MSDDMWARIREIAEGIELQQHMRDPIAIVPPPLAEQARAILGAHRVVVSEYLPPGKAYVYRPPLWLNDPLAPQ